MMVNRLVGLTRSAFPTTFRVLLSVFLVCGFTLPGFSQVFNQDVTLLYNGQPIPASGWNCQIKSFESGKLGIVARDRKYVEWQRGSATVIRQETLPSAYLDLGLAYHNGQARVGGAVYSGAYPNVTRAVEFTRTGVNTWTSSSTGYTSPQYYINWSYDVNPVTGRHCGEGS
jgi:hypothetical protein